MKRFHSIINGPKLWLLIKDLMNTINSGKKPVQEVYRKTNHGAITTAYLNRMASVHCIR